MAESKGKEGIQDLSSVNVEVDGESHPIEIAPGVVQSVTTVVPDDADATSSPDKQPDDVNRPPVSTNRPDVPIAHSLVAGAGAPTGPPDYKPELGPDQDADLGAQAAADAAAKAKPKQAEDKS